MRSLTLRDPGPGTYTRNRLPDANRVPFPLSIDHNETNVESRVIESIMLLMIGALVAREELLSRGRMMRGWNVLASGKLTFG
mgnify:CR=1 FL=1